MTLRVPLTNERYLTLVSIYAPTLCYPDDVKDAFYEELDRVICTVPKKDKPLLIEDFNAHNVL